MELHDIEFEEPSQEEETVAGSGRPGKALFIIGLVLLLASFGVLGFTYFYHITNSAKDPEPEPSHAAIEITYTQAEFEKAVSDARKEATEQTGAALDSEYKNAIFDAARISGGMANYLKYLFPDQLVFTEGSKYIFVPVIDDLKKNKINSSLLKKDEATGFIHYTNANGDITSYTGIDVSSFQKDVDWARVKAAGVDFAIIRCAFRGYGSEGKLVEDNMFISHVESAQAAGIQVGVYFYAQPVTKEEAVEEADMAISLIKDYNIKGPVVMDVELPTNDSRTANLSPAERTDNVIAFCERVKAAGYTPMVYANMKYFVRNLEYERLEDYKKWYANYNDLYSSEKYSSIWAFNDPLYFPYEFDIWQYSESGTVDGIKGKCDLNVLFEKWW